MKKTKTLHLLTATAAAAALLFSGCNMNDTPDYGQTVSETVTSGSLSVTADTINIDPGDTTGVESEFTLSLTGTSFAFSAEADADLSGYITIKAYDADGNEVETVKTGKIRAKDAFDAGVATAKVYTTITDSGKADIADGTLKVSVSGGALNGSGKISNRDTAIDIRTCELTAISVATTSTSEKLGTISDGVLQLSAGADLNTQKVTFFLVPKGATEGYTYKNDTDTVIDFSVIDKNGDVSTVLGSSGTVTAKAATRDGVSGIDITLQGNDTGSWITNYGTFEFEIPASDLVKGETAFGESTETRVFTTSNPVWKINGVSIVLSGDGVENAAAGYGTVGATVTTGEITVTVENGITVNSLTAADTATGFTFTGALVSGSTDTYILTSEEADLSSSADNLSGTLAFTLNATISNENYDIPLEDTVDYTLSYKSYLETPTAAQVILATGGSTTEEVYTTVINLAAFDKALSAVPEAGATVASGTVGSTNVTAVALSGATASYIPVKILGSGLSGAVTLTMSGDDSIVVKQTDALHLASLKYVQDYESATAPTTSVDSFTDSRITYSDGPYTYATTVYASDGSTTLWTGGGVRYGFSITTENSNSYVSVAPSCLPTGSNGATLTATSLGVANTVTDFVLSFDIQLTGGNNQISSFVVNNASGTACLTLTDSAASSTTWLLSDSDSTNAVLEKTTWYTVTLTSSSSSGTSVSIALTSDGTSVVDNVSLSDDATAGIGTMVFNTKRYYAAMAIDNVVVYTTK